MQLPKAEKWLDHLGACSPCFQEFTALHHRHRTQRRLKSGGGLAILALSLVVWFTVRSHQPGMETAVLDLRGYSQQRGEQNLPAPAPLRLQRSPRHLVFYLPIGSREGNYDFAILSDRGEELLSASGTAKIENHNVVLRGEINTVHVQPGSYFLGLRQNGVEWSRFPVQVK